MVNIGFGLPILLLIFLRIKKADNVITIGISHDIGFRYRDFFAGRRIYE